MKEYVLCYVERDNNIVLIEKNKPSWQKGKLNLPGGKVEIGESVHAAAKRELKEETDLDCDIAQLLGTIQDDGYIVYIFKCFTIGILKSLTDEKVLWYPIEEAIREPNLITNLSVIIPMCRLGLTPWCYLDKTNELRFL